MRCRVAVLTLFALLPGMNGWAAQAPPTSAILDIGPPPKGWSMEKHRQEEIRHLTYYRGMLTDVWGDPEVTKTVPKLASITRWQDAGIWLSDNLEVTPVPGKDRLLRLKFRAGSTDEKVAILNSLLRINLQLVAERRERIEKKLQLVEGAVPELEKLVTATSDPIQQARYRKDLEKAPFEIEQLRTEITRLKQAAVIRCAK